MEPLHPSKRNSPPSLSDMKRPVREEVSFRSSYDEYAAFRPAALNPSKPSSYQPFPEEREEGLSLGRVTAPTGSSERRSSYRLPRISSARTFFLISVFIILGGLLLFVLARQGLSAKERVLSESQHGYEELASAEDLLKAKQYEAAIDHFAAAYQSFDRASQELSHWGGPLLNGTRFVPGLSRLASGKHAIEAGKYFAAAGKPLSVLIENVTQSKAAHDQGKSVSLLDLLTQAKDPLRNIHEALTRAEAELSLVTIDDIPEEKREKFLKVKGSLPAVLGLFAGFEQNDQVIRELLGGNGPRTYLFLLQNNHEMRATGGFIGTYALIDINEGVIRRFFVDGIFNPDGQLKENIVPPKPIQKISAGWSLHDSNWFPDFPTSAEKAISFYEKTGGPTVDGVFTLTPTIMQKLLAVIGPIPLPQYGLTVDADNFIPVLQEQVEVKYDKELNQPKKILADLSQALIEKVFALQDRVTTERIAEALVEGLNEKHMLLYLRQPESERLIDAAGWSGRVLETSKDYLSVIHSNINGYKTDGVIDERIEHRAEIQEDGSVIDSVTVTRTHHGGDTPYDWWNKVNADYVRLYVPKGSELLSSEGTTWEFPTPPLDYAKLGWKKDADVEREEGQMVVDQKTGVRISEDAGKTVFGAWAYVSPKESVTLKYRYRLPFRLDPAALRLGEAQSYAVLFQKQSGSPGSKLSTTISYPESFRLIWQTEPNLVPFGRELRRETDLKTDVFQGVVFGK